MKWAAIVSAVLPLASASGFTKEEYANGEVMEIMMKGKEVSSPLMIGNVLRLTIAGGMGKAACSWCLRQQEVGWLRQEAKSQRQD